MMRVRPLDPLSRASTTRTPLNLKVTFTAVRVSNDRMLSIKPSIDKPLYRRRIQSSPRFFADDFDAGQGNSMQDPRALRPLRRWSHGVES
eukprot:5288274-Pyramimonas_sp.AAC.2